MRPVSTIAAASLSLFASSIGSLAQPASSLPYKSGADGRYEIFGIIPGMACDHAALRLAREARKGVRAPTGRSYTAGPPTARKTMQGFFASEFISTAGPLDKVDVSCTGKASNSLVFRIDRTLEFGEAAPTEQQLKQQFEAKLGPFPITLKNGSGGTTYAIMVNERGRMSAADEACGAFTRNTPDAAVARVADNPDARQCAFAVTLTIERLGPNGTVRRARMILFDYTAFLNALDFEDLVQARQREQAPPPKIRF